MLCFKVMKECLLLMGLPLLICELSFLMFGTWVNGSTLIPTISTKFKSNVQVIKNTSVNSLVDIRVIKGIQHKLFILAYETILPLYV